MKKEDLYTNSYFEMGKIEDYLVSVSNKKSVTQNSKNYFGIFFINEGIGNLVIDFHEKKITSNSIICIAPGQIISFSNEALKGIYILFNLEFYHKIKLSFKLYDFPFFHQSIQENYMHLNADEDQIFPLFQRMFLEYKNHEKLGKWTILRYDLEILLILLTRIKPAANTENPKKLVANNQKLRQLEMLIEKHYLEHKNVSFYADQLHISARHLNNIISQITGKSILEMINNRLLTESKRLLLYSEKNISDIAYELGFSDKAYFHRFFKKATLIPPLQFRKNFLKVH